jgi:hypothetical protein
MLKLNIEGMPREALRQYFKELVEMAREPMTSGEREDYREMRRQVAARLGQC